MFVICGECFLAIGCLRWIWKRCTYIGDEDSATWPPAIAEEFESVPQLCHIILAIYLDHAHREIVLAIRRLNLNKDSDYKESKGLKRLWLEAIGVNLGL
ncbi:hypothetical protein L1987_83666 [Smallanthus sonchifolius]|uniref:Uncharacterized protein n=1 Tax=Smallanthus sonchifolius TaxID=185202 RepID=A0ACB8YDP6_9ASTR|nr:hypothetical protein L1987_83666 [Smallanthus sonchifolius]